MRNRSDNKDTCEFRKTVCLSDSQAVNVRVEAQASVIDNLP